MQTGTINVAKLIGVHWETVGITLLHDEFGSIVPAIHRQCHRDLLDTNLEILRRWIGGEGIGEHTWRELLHALKNHDCKALAEEIEKELPNQAAHSAHGKP